MLTKLIKTDLRSTARTFIPVCIGLLVLAVAMIICISVIPRDADNASDVADVSIVMAYIICYLTIGVFSVLAFLVPLLRFRRCILKNDAYLMLTIPIRPSLHIASKLICSVVWYIAVQLCKAVVTGIMIYADKEDTFGISDIYRMITLGSSEGKLEIENVIYILMNFLNSLMLIIMAQLFMYTVFAVASMSGKNQSILSVLLAIGGSVALSWGYGIVFALTLRIGDNDILDYMTSASRYAPTLIYYCVMSLVFYFAAAFILDKKYNLQ